MRAVVQRAVRASVTIKATGERREIARGLLVLLGVGHHDTASDTDWLAEKVAGLRIFEDATGKMNRSLTDVPAGSMLVVSQFTLYGDVRRGRRPSFTDAAPPTLAAVLYERFVAAVVAHGIPVVTGDFGEDMLVEVANDGPVTLILETGHADAAG